MAEKQELTRIPVYGSLAYDFETVAAQPAPEWEYPQREERKVVIPAPPPQTEEQRRAQPLTRPKQSVSLLSILGFACAAVLLIFTLMAKINLTVVTDEAAALEKQLNALELEQNRLLIKYESVFNRTEIEEYAVGSLGMQRPRQEQIVYINSSAPDKAVVLEEESSSKGILDSISDVLGLIGEYFK